MRQVRLDVAGERAVRHGPALNRMAAVAPLHDRMVAAHLAARAIPGVARCRCTRPRAV
ncbi:hypothetical protein ACFWN1_03360 [Streptomyces sp. NPDC058459]|uniref:hypothetical protein n=1 Tax=Streptomyces sp. NPDC058459 TaxID=3346508 RepID=UPI00364D7B09